ncbi:hypothetical protein [uncultured Ruegeria sp.]|uniref:hypothetical protein n=1 Tax=uncultured Ruegeria sp. TaxID=259304 RepID=UPI002623DE9C|nr:hypothetical protein [uncultured Ruegeria sp.]
MAQDKTVHKKNLKDNLWRDLQVYYDKGGTNFWSYEPKPKGIYFSSHIYRLIGTEAGNIKTWSTGQKGDGYLLIVPLERYSAKQLRLVRERVEADPERIHTMLDQGKVTELKQLLAGETLTIPSTVVAT